ncbi:hypothetical protein BEN49_18725 [Hymenobacter coccineus]|uniref:LysM domain-containing protein n=1 Tax=Hymenobacter coccineus TaxID=1908235 RepID=A0A1G1TLK0_9BACT|nr:hypothetical protein BEN49_18725 [Hymenobacter coccineus]
MLAGETLYSLSKRYAVSVSDLQAGPPAPAATPAVWHAVLAGETLYSLSKRYAVSVSDLQAWNHKADASVRLGEVLRMNAPPAR